MSPRRRRRAHPRWRGEDRQWGAIVAEVPGSSPLARGGQRASPFFSRILAAHPRWRGEDEVNEMSERDRAGSSPLARGGLELPPDAKGMYGLIPAGAGRTSSRATPPAPTAGSSPLARGGRDGAAVAGVVGGLIPAGAGRTRRSSPPPNAATAHPRWRGEDGLMQAAAGAGQGSSPLARGGPRMTLDTYAHVGLIPAGAGRTVARRWSPRP